jgi:hypothetical protein
MSKLGIGSTYSSHSLSDSGGNSNWLAGTGVAASASLARGGGNLNKSDSLSLGGVESRGDSVGGVLSRLGSGNLGVGAGLSL